MRFFVRDKKITDSTAVTNQRFDCSMCSEGRCAIAKSKKILYIFFIKKYRTCNILAGFGRANFFLEVQYVLGLLVFDTVLDRAWAIPYRYSGKMRTYKNFEKKIPQNHASLSRKFVLDLSVQILQKF